MTQASPDLEGVTLRKRALPRLLSPENRPAWLEDAGHGARVAVVEGRIAREKHDTCGVARRHLAPRSSLTKAPVRSGSH